MSPEEYEGVRSFLKDQRWLDGDRHSTEYITWLKCRGWVLVQPTMSSKRHSSLNTLKGDALTFLKRHHKYHLYKFKHARSKPLPSMR